MEKEYLVKTYGYVILDKEENYVINANDEEDAKVRAQEMFKEDYALASERINFKVESRSDKFLKLSLICMIISVIFIYIPWSNDGDLYNICPHLLSTLYGIVFYTSFIVRFKGLKNVFLSKIDLIMSILMIIIISSLFEIILGRYEVGFLFMNFDIDPNIIIIIALLLSCLGMKMVSVACYIFVGFLALTNIIGLSVAMGPLFGPLFVLTSYLSIGIYIACDPLLRNAFPSIYNTSKRTMKYLYNDFNAAKDEFNTVKENVKSINNEKEA